MCLDSTISIYTQEKLLLQIIDFLFKILPLKKFKNSYNLDSSSHCYHSFTSYKKNKLLQFSLDNFDAKNRFHFNANYQSLLTIIAKILLKLEKTSLIPLL